MSSAPEVYALRRNGWVPNNDRWPLLVYRGAVPATGDVAAALEALFQKNGWPAQWRNGIYRFHHYHSTAHEALGDIAAGTARLVFGGEHGAEITANAGDVAVLPAGTGHCKLSASSDFLVVGAYPAGQDWDTCREAPTAEMQERLSHVHYPCDPVTGGQPVT